MRPKGWDPCAVINHRICSGGTRSQDQTEFRGDQRGGTLVLSSFTLCAQEGTRFGEAKDQMGGTLVLSSFTYMGRKK